MNADQKRVSMEGQPVGDPHPCDLARAGQHPVTGAALSSSLVSLTADEREELVRYHKRLQEAAQLQDDFDGSWQHRQRWTELFRGLTDDAQRAVHEKTPKPDVGGWLWRHLMDWCRKRGVHPSNYNDLFDIVRAARAEFE